jgi:type II secretory pathway component PulC
MIDELISPLLTTIWGRRLGLGLLLVMALLMLVTFIETLVAWRGDYYLTHPVRKPAPSQANATNQLNTQIAAIPGLHIFGAYGVADRSSLLPVTSLQIKLVGIIKSAPEKLSRVLISESGQPARVYQVGDALPTTGVEISAITSDGVVLDNSGRLEKLPLQRSSLQFQGMPKSVLGE